MATSKQSSKPSRHAVRPRARHARARRPVRPRAAAEPPPLEVDPRLIEGIALFNHRQFFACHEVLERLWLATDGRPRDFYRGLIQAAVACYHWSRGNPAGAMSLYRSSSRYLRRYRPAYLGVDVEGFLERYTELFGWLRRHRVPYEARLVPALRWLRSPRVTVSPG